MRAGSGHDERVGGGLGASGDTVNFDSRFAIGEDVIGLGQPARVMAVRFTASKVCYDLEMDEGGEPVLNVDSVFVEPL